MSKKSHRLAILGAYPPPFGGVTVHTKRLSALLRDHDLDYRIYNTVSESHGARVISVYRNRSGWLLRFLLSAREKAIYIMSPRLSMWLAGAWLAKCRGKRVLIRIRNAQLKEWSARSLWRRTVAGFALRQVAGVVCVSKEIEQAVRDFGVEHARIHHFPGFLPPTDAELAPNQIDPLVHNFICNRKPLLVANGKVSQFQGEDLYGLDLITSLARRLITDFPHLGIVICLSENEDHANRYIEKLADRPGVADSDKTIFYNRHTGPFLPLLGRADLFLRPTNTDGDANSIREALYMGVPVVASDASHRPKGVFRFRSRNMNDFENKVRVALSGGSGAGQKYHPSPDPETEKRAADYIELLGSLIK